MNFNHGNESRQHRRAKKLIAVKLRLLGYAIFPEYRLCDIAAFRRTEERFEVLCVEFETSSRTADTNVLRNIANGAHRCLTICANASVKAAAARKFKKNLPPEILAKTQAMTLRDFLSNPGAPCGASPVETTTQSRNIKEKYDRTN